MEDLDDHLESNDMLSESLSKLYQKLISENKPLEPEFQKIIQDNICGLYEN